MSERYDTLNQRWAREERRAEKFAHVISRFREEFGRDKIWFELLDYDNDVGICVEAGSHEGGDFRRMAVRFNQKDPLEFIPPALSFAHAWMRGKTHYEGVPGDYTLEGHEITARAIANGEVA